MKQAVYPQGFVVIQRGATTIAIRETYCADLLQQGIESPEKLIRDCQKNHPAFLGRGLTPVIPIEARKQETMVMRKCRRGGLLRFFMPDLYWGAQRLFNELRVATDAFNSGIATAPILAAVSERAAGPFYKGYLISSELPSAADLPTVLAAIATNARRDAFTRKRALLAKVARAIRSMHDRGFLHGDLNLKNILIDTHHEDRVYIVDWDKSRHKKRLSRTERRKNVLRFCRSMMKLREQGLALTERDQLYFLRAYWGDNKQLQQRLRRDYMRIQLSGSVRKIRWKIANLFDRRHYYNEKEKATARY